MADYAIAGNFYLSGSGWAQQSVKMLSQTGQENWENYLQTYDKTLYFRNKYENPYK